jgi:hypothetical protein
MPLEKPRTPLEQIITHLPSTIKKSVACLWKNHAHLWNKSSHTCPRRLKSPWHASGKSRTPLEQIITHLPWTIKKSVARLWKKSRTPVEQIITHIAL